MTKVELLAKIKGKLIVSCQALPDEPLHSPYIMGRLAVAAKEGGACAIRANSVADIAEIRKRVSLPIIGLIKRVFTDSAVYITPTAEEVERLIAAGVTMVAVDATQRTRPGGLSLDEFFTPLRKKYPGMLFMADCSTPEEGLHAARLHFDFVSSTLTGYTAYTQGTPLPAYDVMRAMVENTGLPVIGEGGIWTPEELKKAFEAGICAAVVGTAITRPREITQRFVDAIR